MSKSCAEATKNMPHRTIVEQALQHLEHLPLVAVDCGCGCGAGNESHDLLQQGYTVHAFDPFLIAQELCIARFKNNIYYSFYAERFETFQFPKVSLIVALLSLFFCHPTHLENVLKKIKTALPSNGVFLLQLLDTEDAWVKHTPQKFKGFSKAQIIDLFISDYKIIHHQEKRPLANGQLKDWHLHTLILKKR